jgi:hypothetical protein
MTFSTSAVAVCYSRASANSRVRARTCSFRSLGVELAGRAPGALRFGLVGLRCCVANAGNPVRRSKSAPLCSCRPRPQGRSRIVRRLKKCRRCDGRRVAIPAAPPMIADSVSSCPRLLRDERVPKPAPMPAMTFSLTFGSGRCRCRRICRLHGEPRSPSGRLPTRFDRA